MTSHRTHPTRAEFRFWWPVTVRWGDMDAMGHVNNAIYFQYLESARVGYFETLVDWTGRDEGGGRQGPVVVSQTFNYRLQVVTVQVVPSHFKWSHGRNLRPRSRKRWRRKATCGI